MKYSTQFLSLFVLFVSGILSLEAQTGHIRGQIIDDQSGETLIGVTVLIEGTGNGAITDLDGMFDLEVAPGLYALRISYVSFQTINIPDVQVATDSISALGVIRMAEALSELDVVVVSVKRTRDSEPALLTMKMKSPNLLDGISSANFAKIGDSDAASAMKRVTGVSVTGGKYVFVRGLGDRYTKTMLNGMDIPGLDPDRNTLQMDIFPTNVLDNILVYKSFTADLPADFTGGVIDIALRDFPESPTAGVSVNVGYNPSFHFNPNYLTYDGGSTDWLGFDDGTRDIPATENIPFFSEVVGDPDGPEADRYKEILGAFNPTMAAYRTNSGMDFGLSGSAGNQYVVNDLTIGYTVAASYRNTTEFYEDALYARYGLSSDYTVNEMEAREYQEGDFGSNSVLLTGMAGVAVKTKTSKYRLHLMHLQNGESRAGIFDYINTDQGAEFFGVQHNLEYGQRGLTNLLLSGEHETPEGKWNYTWKLSPTYSALSDPDIRFTRYELKNDSYYIGTEAGFPERIWRDLQEFDVASQFHAKRKMQLFGADAQLSTGAAYTFKTRDYIIRSFQINVRNLNLTGDPNELFSPENIWPYNGDVTSGTTIEVSFLPANPNQFEASSHNIAAYGSLESKPWEKVSTILGVRMEKFMQFYTGQDQLGINVLDNDLVLDELGIFPSLNVIYTVKEKQNLRFSYSKTIARPSFKELSYAEIYDPITGRVFVGGLFRDANDFSGDVYWDGDLRSTDVHNADIRWELFQDKGELISGSVFYKKFYDVIEIVQFATQAGSFQPRNVGDGQVAGVEVEIRKDLDFIHARLIPLNLSLNVTLTESSIRMSNTEYESRLENARDGEVIDEYRQMAGQAPYIINTGLTYKRLNNQVFSGFEAALFYNVQGTTLLYVGIADRPDIYTLPFHSLNLNMTKYFGEANRWQVALKFENILNDNNETVFQSYQAADQYFTLLKPGRSVGLKINYNIL